MTYWPLTLTDKGRHSKLGQEHNIYVEVAGHILDQSPLVQVEDTVDDLGLLVLVHRVHGIAVAVGRAADAGYAAVVVGGAVEGNAEVGCSGSEVDSHSGAEEAAGGAERPWTYRTFGRSLFEIFLTRGAYVGVGKSLYMTSREEELHQKCPRRQPPAAWTTAAAGHSLADRVADGST